jgi:hypothetical protein
MAAICICEILMISKEECMQGMLHIYVYEYKRLYIYEYKKTYTFNK